MMLPIEVMHPVEVYKASNTLQAPFVEELVEFHIIFIQLLYLLKMLTAVAKT